MNMNNIYLDGTTHRQRQRQNLKGLERKRRKKEKGGGNVNFKVDPKKNCKMKEWTLYPRMLRLGLSLFRPRLDFCLGSKQPLLPSLSL